MNIRIALYVFAAALALAAVASAESSNEESFAEATSFVQAFMSEQKGGDSACRKVASDSIETIKTECKALQKTIDEAAGQREKCCHNGKDAVCSAQKNKADLDGKSSTCKGKADAIAKAKIKFTSSLAALKNGKCDAIRGSYAYKNKKAQHRSKMKECNKLSGAASEAKKTLKAAIKAANNARKRCMWKVNNARNKIFINAQKACNSRKNRRAFTRAQHMKCVLDGKSLKRCKVGKIPFTIKRTVKTTTCSGSSKKWLKQITTCSSKI